MMRKSWDLDFLAEAKEVAELRRVMAFHLKAWGLHEAVAAAQVCVSELVANVITHVGEGTPATLAVSMSGTFVRMEVHDPDVRALPTLRSATDDAESGRGLALVGEAADRWGVLLRADRKITWCEIATTLTSPLGHGGGVWVTRAEALLRSQKSSLISVALAEQEAIRAIADLLHWLRCHGRDPDEALDRAQNTFDMELDVY
ncbi:ATP-binding protein [Streptomyces sp. NPDC046716]|uniref:ATP-binding protein n=1 Tax=Streptomyces sp. NPDC046716 TaxID=3157093 RepID=UPI0033D50686